MKTNMKQKGFTLIELLVVIVIIGILATISVATFSGYFGKARDSERATVVQTAATIMKTARAVDTITTYDGTTTAGNFGTTIAGATEVGLKEILLEEGGYDAPDGNTPYFYYYISEGDNEFAFMVCSEENALSVLLLVQFHQHKLF